MGAEVIPFDFEEQAVRVVMRDDEPWFVAKDVCLVLDISKYRDAISRLDDDERVSVVVDTLGGQQQMTAISESGLYALVFTSRKPEAKRFRKWITSEVLPAIRKTGRYEMPAPVDAGISDAFTPRDWLAMVREARILGGLTAGRRMWDRSPLPPLSVVPAVQSAVDPCEARAALHHLMTHLGAAIDKARANSTDDLVDEGMRCVKEGLFVANYSLPVFCGTRWDNGAHRDVLRALPGAFSSGVGRTLGAVRTRGVVLPWELLEGAKA